LRQDEAASLEKSGHSAQCGDVRAGGQKLQKFAAGSGCGFACEFAFRLAHNGPDSSALLAFWPARFGKQRDDWPNSDISFGLAHKLED
jgi:hypothetical protein